METWIIKFQSTVHLNVASEKLRYFKIASGHMIRFLPFDQNLYKGGSGEPFPSKLPGNESAMSKSMYSASRFEEDKENTVPDDNLPDNSNLQCNLCVRGLDHSLTSEDLHFMFEQYGEIKSAKVATDLVTGKSKCYGFVWFTTEKACNAALDAAAELPYPFSLFKPSCIRECEQKKPIQNNVLLISGYPADYNEK